MAGTIIDKGNNKYLLRYMYNKKRYNKTVTATTPKKAEKMLDEWIYEIEHNQEQDKSTMYFNDFTKMWLNDYVYNNLELRTQEYYENLLKQNIYDYFNGYKLDEIKRNHIIEFINSLQTKYTKTSLRQYRNCLVTIFNYAIKLDILNSNPATLVDLPKGKIVEKKENVISEENLKNVIKLIDNDNIPLDRKLILKIALFGGLRRQEILALTIDDINAKENYISINKAISKSRRCGIYVKETKTKNSNRIVYLPSNIIKQILSLEVKKDNRLFEYDPDYISKWVYKWVKKHNLEHFSLHGLRHTTATTLIANGIDYKTVSAVLGHSNTSTTLNIYTHKVNSNIKKASEIFNNLT